jgi:hypothetical protein
MKEIIANIWDIYKNYDAICCTTNYIVKGSGELVMGAGIAKEFSTKYPWLAKNWGERVSRGWKSNCHPGVFVTLMKSRPHLVYFGTKWHYKDPSDIKLIESGLDTLYLISTILDWKNILLPRPGCSNGGLNWEKDIKPLCEESLDDRFTIISRI